ncbi:hypothetical protein I6H96_02530 [Brucella anthropi]|uniref:hypothetical protein n=1 Tax=Brucella anthropi TaxID=529 RepID=UPI0002D55781|nr:hypothetical protein [Brucella anthropi]NKC48120.1 hypothetical protein [Brucella anthropi ATCC 49188]QQC25758.1 hypothetical protein I6H96_02530 [Brucella anthropi]SUA65530.1 Uncharacterised protein [Brucella anthropi]
MQSYFEIYVSLNGTHFFATAPRSCITQDAAEGVAKEIRSRFPEADGFKVSVTHYRCSGHTCDF